MCITWRNDTSFFLYGITPDVFISLLFTICQPVYYATYNQHFPSESEQRAAYWVGFGEYCGAVINRFLSHFSHTYDVTRK